MTENRRMNAEYMWADMLWADVKIHLFTCDLHIHFHDDRHCRRRRCIKSESFHRSYCMLECLALTDCQLSAVAEQRCASGRGEYTVIRWIGIILPRTAYATHAPHWAAGEFWHSNTWRMDTHNFVEVKSNKWLFQFSFSFFIQLLELQRWTT